MTAYDTWLEAPYTRAAEETEAFYAYCDERNIDPNLPESQAAWSAHVDALETYYDMVDFPRPPAGAVRWCCDCGDAPVWLASEGNEVCFPCDLARKAARDDAYFAHDTY